MKKLQIILTIAITIIPFIGKGQQFNTKTYTYKTDEKIAELAVQEDRDKFKNDKLAKWLKVETVHLYGGGQLINLLTTNNPDVEQSSPSGSLGINFNTEKISSNIFFSYNGKQQIDVNKIQQFGANLLNPNNSGQSLNLAFRAKIHRNYGALLEFSAVDSDWKIDSTSVVDASPIITKIGGFVRPFIFDLEENDLDLTIEFKYTIRNIVGDFANQERTIDQKMISNTTFKGFEAQLNLRFNSVKMYMQMAMNNPEGIDIPGFSGNQLVFGIDVTGNLIKLK